MDMKTHLSINVKNIEESVAFYTKLFGAEPVKVRTDYAKFDIADPPLNFTMNQVNVEKGNSLSHLGLQADSTDDVIRIAEQWESAGLSTRKELQTDCCYALQNKVWAEDPDGNGWEVFTVLQDTEGQKDAASGCCTPAVKGVSITRSESSASCT